MKGEIVKPLTDEERAQLMAELAADEAKLKELKRKKRAAKVYLRVHQYREYEDRMQGEGGWDIGQWSSSASPELIAEAKRVRDEWLSSQEWKDYCSPDPKARARRTWYKRQEALARSEQTA